MSTQPRALKIESTKTTRQPAGGRFAFTLVELMIVIVVILMLVGLLLPALNSARSRAKKVATETYLASLGQASESYKAAFGSYPGYLHDGWQDRGVEHKDTMKLISATENALISLMGYAQHESAGQPANHVKLNEHYVDLDKVGRGPRLADGTMMAPFFNPKKGQVGEVTGLKWDPAGNRIPEFLDPVSGMPLLYFRVYNDAPHPTGYWRYDRDAGFTELFGSTTGITTQASYVRAKELKSPDGRIVNQADNSLLSVEGGTFNDTVASHNFAAFIIDKRFQVYGESSRDWNDKGNTINGGYIWVAPGEDGIYFNRFNAGPSGPKEIVNLDVLEKFDDTVYIGGSN